MSLSPKLQFVLSSFLICQFSCGREVAQLRDRDFHNLDATAAEDPHKDLELKLGQIKNSQLRRLWQNGSDQAPSLQLVSALAECQCSPVVLQSLIDDNLTNRGVLHQALMPNVREKIRSNPDLIQLLSLPGGIQDVVRQIFASDEAITKLIRDGIMRQLESMWKSLKSDNLNFVFDGMTPMFSLTSSDFLGHPSKFTISEQALRWKLIFTALRKDAVAQPDLVVSTAKALSEWKYLFGLDNDESQQSYGGLTLDTQNGDSALLRRYDPRVDTDYVGFLSGTYEVFYPTGESIDLATSVKELWIHDAGAVTLDEQSALWEAAAEAYHSLRPLNRAKWDASIDAETLPIERGAHQIALIFIKSVPKLLDGPFIDLEARIIRARAKLGSGAFDDEPASVSQLAKLIRALSKWAQLQLSAERDELEENVLAEMQKGYRQIKEPLRLAIQKVMTSDISALSFAERAEAILAVGNALEVLQSDTLTQWLRSELAALLETLATLVINSQGSPGDELRVIILWSTSVAGLAQQLFPDEPLGVSASKLKVQLLSVTGGAEPVQFDGDQQ